MCFAADKWNAQLCVYIKKLFLTSEDQFRAQEIFIYLDSILIFLLVSIAESAHPKPLIGSIRELLTNYCQQTLPLNQLARRPNSNFSPERA